VLQSPSLFLITKRRHLGPSRSHHSDCWADGRGVRRPCCTAGFSQAPPSEMTSCDSRAPFLGPFPAFSFASCKENLHGGSLAATRKLHRVQDLDGQGFELCCPPKDACQVLCQQLEGFERTGPARRAVIAGRRKALLTVGLTRRSLSNRSVGRHSPQEGPPLNDSVHTITRN
jgi:hypothetical protein